MHEMVGFVGLGDEVPEHGLGDFEIGDDAVLHGADSFDVAGHASEHALGVVSHGEDDLVAAVVSLHGYDGRFAEHESVSFHVNAGVGRAEINGEICRDTPSRESRISGHI